MTLIINDIADVASHIGTPLGATEWMDITQERINMFADATEDHQFIHVDPEAAKSTPFGTTIAHGFLVLSLVPKFLDGLIALPNIKMMLNYGLNKVRFINPVKVNSRLRCEGVIKQVTEASGGTQIIVELTVEIEGEDKPACIIETILLVFV